MNKPTCLFAASLAANALVSEISDAAETAAAATKPVAAAQTASAGLVNDWLRSEWPSASAWDLGGQFRLRYEVKDDAGSFPNRDFLRGLDNSNDYLLFRTKVHIGWTPEPWVTAFVEGRDSHDHGDERPVSETDAFDLYQAYLRLGDPKKFPLSLKVGRQEMLYGDERYVGISDWSNTGRSFDAAKVRYENEQFWVDAFTGRQIIPYDEHFNVANDYDWFSGVYASTRSLFPVQETELYFLSRNVSAGSPTAITPTLGGPGPRDIYTVGTRWNSIPGKLGGWDYAFEAAGQFGSINSAGIRLDHQAFAVNGSGSYTWKDAFGSPRVGAGYDFGSGDSNPTDGKNETFELLFGTNHKLYGLMDVFGLRNMHIPRINGSIKPVKDLTLSLEWLGFWLADNADFIYPESGAGRNQNGYARNAGFSSYAGNEVDLTANWRVTKWGNLQAGYGHLFAGAAIRDAASRGGFQTEDANWVYVQAIFNF